MKHIRVYWLTCILIVLFAGASAHATTIVMPTDEQLVTKSPVIVEGTVLQSLPVDRDGRIWTETSLQVTKTIKGDATGTITIREIGGIIGDRITKIFGAPEYAAGEHVLVFLTPTPRGDYQTVDLFVGKFTEERMLDGRKLWARHDEAGDVALLDHNFRPLSVGNIQREATSFEQYVQDRVSGRKGAANYGIENPVIEHNDASSGGGKRAIDNFTLISEPTVYRWAAFDTGGSANWYSYGTQPGYTGGGVSEIQTAMNAWNSYTSAKIHYNYVGATTSTPGGLSHPNGVNEVLFNDPLGEISGSWNPATGGVVGQGGFNGVSGSQTWNAPFTADASHTQKAYSAFIITEGNLTIQDNVSSSQGISSTRLAEIVAHEFGHTLGLGHSTDNTALMYPTVTGLGPSLRADDQLAARWLYPNGAQSGPPPTPTVPAAPSALTASASGTTVTLHWIDNATNDTGESIFEAASGAGYSKVGDVPAGTTGATVNGLTAGSFNFYVVAFNAAGSSSPSNVAGVTIAGSAAVQAGFTVSPASGIAGQTTFAFTDQSTGSITSRTWQFGDGGTSTLINPTHVYTTAGFYTVSLTVAGGGTQSSTTRQVSVTAPPVALTAAFTFSPGNPTANQTVNFTDQSTGGITGWAWSFGDGSTSNQQNPSKQFTVSGAYNVSLTVFRNAETATISHTVVVTTPLPATPAPSASFDFSPSSPKAGDAVTFTDRSSGSPSSWSWSFGDGSNANSSNPTHAYGAPGNYLVSLTVTNSAGSSTATRNVNVASSAALSYRSLVAATAQTNGVGNSVWRTELNIFNASSTTAVVQLTFIPGNGGASLNHTVSVGAKQTVTFANALQDLFGLSSGAGALGIQSDGSSSAPDLRVTSRTFTTGSNGTYGQSVPEVSSTDLDPTLYLTGIAANANYRTNIGIVNRSSSPANATLVLTDANGALVGSTTISVPANNFQQAPLSNYFPAVSTRAFDVLSMKVTVSTASAVSVYASVIDNRTQDPIYISGAKQATGSSMVIPAVGRVPGVNNTFWRSDVTVFNPSSFGMNIGVRYLAAGADNRGAASQNLFVGAGQTLVLGDIAGRLGISSGSGALQVSWSGAAAPVVTSRTYTPTDNGGTYGQSVDPVAGWGRDVFVSGLRSDSAFRSNVGLVNSSSQPISVTVSLLSSFGSVLATNTVGLAPQSQMQWALSTLFPGVNTGSLGNFTLQAHTDSGATLFAYGSMIDNSSGDPVFFSGR